MKRISRVSRERMEIMFSWMLEIMKLYCRIVVARISCPFIWSKAKIFQKGRTDFIFKPKRPLLNTKQLWYLN